ncbi:MAG: PQQ-binding-like beta-propeller repeat protein [Roseburia sp.]
MKKISCLVAGLLVLGLCACGNKEDSMMPVDSTMNSDSQKETTYDTETETNSMDITNATDITYTTGVMLTNNDMYDKERRKFDFNTKLGDFDGFEVWGEGTQTFITNMEGNIIVKLLVKNTSSEDVAFTVKDIEEKDCSGEYTKYITDYEVLWHPNGVSKYVLTAGSEKMMEVDFSLAHSPIASDLIADFNFNATFGVMDIDGNYKEHKVYVTENIGYLVEETLLSDAYCNAIVSGRIVDENGNPIAGADVEVLNPFIGMFDTQYTDENGYYTITTVAAKNTYADAWREMALSVYKEGYNRRYIPVYPKNNQTVTADITLYPQDEQLIYEEVAIVDTGLQSYEYDTDHSSVITFVPFHTGYDPKKVSDKIRATGTDFDGNVLFTYALPQEIPYVDVSEDGQYSVVMVNELEGGFKTVILDRNGDEVYATHDLPGTDKPFAPKANEIASSMTRCAELSNDNKYLIASDIEGDIWFIDWQNDKVIYSDWLTGQVRNIKFSKDNNEVYVSTGGGNLYAFDLTGKLLWQTDTQSWATKMEVTEKYVVVTTKCAGKNLLVYDRKTGDLVWEYVTMQNNMSLDISPDEKYLWYGAHSSSTFSKIGCSIFELETGKLVGMLNDQNSISGEFSVDGSKIITRDGANVNIYNAKNGALLWTKWFTEGDCSMNTAAAFNEDGTKFVVAMNDENVNEGFGRVHFYKLTGVEKKTTENNEDRKEENNDYADTFLSIVKVKINPEMNLYLDSLKNIIQVECVNDDARKLAEVISDGGEVLLGRPFLTGLEIILTSAIDSGYLKEKADVSISLDEISINYEADYEKVLEGADDVVRDVISDKHIDFSCNVTCEDYRVRDDRNEHFNGDFASDHESDHESDNESDHNGNTICKECNGSGTIVVTEERTKNVYNGTPCRICNDVGTVDDGMHGGQRAECGECRGYGASHSVGDIDDGSCGFNGDYRGYAFDEKTVVEERSETCQACGGRGYY